MVLASRLIMVFLEHLGSWKRPLESVHKKRGEKEGFAWKSFLTRHCPVIDFWCRFFFFLCVCVPVFFLVICVACQGINKQLHVEC